MRTKCARSILALILLAAMARAHATPVTHIAAFFREGQVFVTWDNIALTGIVYTVYRSPNPILYGYQLPSAQNLGNVRDNSALDQRLSELSGGTPKYIKIDSASAPLGSNKGLFVATSTAAGSFYYAVTVKANGVEDTVIVPGSNALVAPVVESVMMPKPVWQEARIIGSQTFEIYVQFATKVTSSMYPLMTNAGSYPFHFALIKSGTVVPHPVSFRMHGDTKSLFPGPETPGIGDPNEWIISIDDWLPDDCGTTCYYGYHENYDIYSSTNPVPTSGILYDYTFARVKHTVDWALRNLPVDSTRTYLTGVSAGAIGALFSAFMIPSRIAAIAIFAPQCDMSTTVFPTDNQRWGTPESNLMSNDGYGRRDRLNANFLARINRTKSLPILYVFCGKNDEAVGWAEKIPFYDTLNAYRHGGHQFWGMTNHAQTIASSPWRPSFPNFSFLVRYRTNLSYPAFSNSSTNDNPGNGNPSDGAAVGTINGHLEWDDNIVDEPDRWEITLRLKDLSTIYGSDPAPDSGTTDVTLRRLQAFSVRSRSMINWENRRNNIVVQQASFVYDSGLVTIPGVRVYKDSSRLAVTYTPVAVAEQNPVPQEFALLQNYPNPFNSSTTIRIELPKSSVVRLSVYDILGREVSVLVNDRRNPGVHEVKFDASGLSSGVYFYRLQAGDFTQTKQLLLLR